MLMNIYVMKFTAKPLVLGGNCFYKSLLKGAICNYGN